MPLFEVKGPDGKTYEVDAPDAQTAAGAIGGGPKKSLPLALVRTWRAVGGRSGRGVLSTGWHRR